MTAVWIRARAELRTKWRPLVGMMVLLGVAGGVVLAAAAGARRTESSYHRYLAWSHASDATMASSDIPQLGLGRVDLRRVEDLPEVERSALGTLVFLPGFHGTKPASSGAGPAVGLAFPSTPQAVGMDLPKVLAGRPADPRDPNEVTVGYGATQTLGLRVGMRETVELIRGDKDIVRAVTDPSYRKTAVLATVHLTIVGEVFTPGDVPPTSFGDVYLTPAFYRRYASGVARIDGLEVRLRRGGADIPAFQRQVEAMVRGGSSGFTAQGAATKRIQRSIHLQAIALWLFCGLASVALALVLGQGVIRQVFVGSTEHPILRSMGMTTGQLVGVSLVRPAATAAGGALLAVGVAVALSGVFPTGLARVVEPHTGFSSDWSVFGVAALSILLVVVGLGAIPAWRAGRARAAGNEADRAAARRRPSFLAGSMARAGMRPSAVAGARLALESGRGRTATPVRTAILGVALSFAAVAAAFTFSSSFDRLIATPRLVGWNWNVAVGNAYGNDIARETIPALRSEPFVAEFSGGNVLASVQVRRGSKTAQVDAFSLQQIEGTVTPPVLEGRWPTADDEVALGTTTMHTLGARMGDVVTIHRARGGTARLRVVGRVVLTDLGNGDANPGEGAGLTFGGLQAIRPDSPETIFFVRYRPGTDPHAAADALQQLAAVKTGTGGVMGPADVKSQALNDLRRVNHLPLALAGLLFVAALATLAHTLVTSIRRRNRDLALLKTLGFVNRQVSATVAWQASILALAAVLVGVPLGLAAGRWGWRAFADQLGTVPQPVIPLIPVLLALPVSLVMANLVAAVPGWLASRVRPAVALRTE